MKSILILFGLLLCGCRQSPRNLLIGKWEIESPRIVTEFHTDGTTSFSALGQTLNGTYRWNSPDELETNLNGRVARSKAEVREEALELTNENHETIVFKRISH
jgi:hypothetical protein